MKTCPMTLVISFAFINFMLMMLDPPTLGDHTGMKSQLDLTLFRVGVPLGMMARLPLS